MFESLKAWLSRRFGDHNRDLLKAADVLRAFPSTYSYNPNMAGLALILDNRIVSFDALTWLAYSRKFEYLGLRTEIIRETIVPVCGRFTMIAAVREAFDLTAEQMTHLFSPALYEGISMNRIADRLESCAKHSGYGYSKDT
jgi:hypothetical protein